jgi:hypothetical protein
MLGSRSDSYAIGGTALLGIRASGKTYCAKGIAEQLLEHRVPIIVFDPIGTWRHLKVPASKNGKGYPVVVAGGKGADLPLTPDSATEIVRAAMRENIPLVVDLYDKSLSKADWRRIVQKCFRTLLYENEGVRHIFLEEAAEYVPQNIRGGDGETYAEVEKLVRMGGNHSLGITLINQRAQEVNKAVLDLCENLVLMRQMGAHAIDALEKWIDKVSPDFASKIAAGMPKMTAGECWVFAGGAEKPIFTRSGTIRTFHPDRKNPDAKIAAAATDTSSFVEAMQRALPAIVEQQQANDPKKLKARIAELERQVANVQPPAPVPTVDTATLDRLRAEIAELWNNVRIRNDELNKRADFIRECRDALSPLSNLIARLELADSLYPKAGDPNIDAIVARNYPKLSKTPAIKVQKSASVPRAAATPAPRTSSANRHAKPDGLSKPEFAFLRALWWLRDEERTAEKVAFYAGYSVTSSSFSNSLGALRSGGLVQAFGVTNAGERIIAHVAGEKPTGRELREWVRPKLNKAENAFLDALIDANGARLDDEALCARAGYSITSSSFSNSVGRLRSIGAAQGYAKDGGTRAADVFLE